MTAVWMLLGILGCGASSGAPALSPPRRDPPAIAAPTGAPLPVLAFTVQVRNSWEGHHFEVLRVSDSDAQTVDKLGFYLYSCAF